jgi:hypothetical protein
MTAAEAAEQLWALIRDEAELYGDVGKRIIANRLVENMATWLLKQTEPKPTTVEPMSEREAKMFDAETIAFGKYQGRPFREIPTSYLSWLADSQRALWREIHRYLTSPANREGREGE